MRLEIRLLGMVEVTAGGRPVTVVGRMRVLLLALAMSAGRPVSSDRLIETMWPAELPQHPLRSLQTYIARLRKVLGHQRIENSASGYVLLAGPDEVDALRFVEHLERAAAAAGTGVERKELESALALWHGNPFEGQEFEGMRRSDGLRLVERYLAAVERWVDLEVAAGPPDAGLVTMLQELSAQHPLREPLQARLLTALARSGRQAEALGHYETVRNRIAEELGVDPGMDLQAVYRELLSPDSPREPGMPANPVTMAVAPRQLPAGTAGFTGRRNELSTLDMLLDGVTSAVVITAIGGTAGVGKTALAVHWAHQVADHFPDGQLFADLRGFDPSGEPRQTAEVMRFFLEVLGVRPGHMPSSLDSQVGMYRSLMAGKRMLVVLDNARDADQVRPLLPGAAGCLALVTSRDQLFSLVTAEGAQCVPLDVLPMTEAWLLLENRLGAARLRDDPAATQAIIERCSFLPLALGVAAARAALRPTIPLRSIAEELRVLDGFGGPSPATDVRSVFSWSYLALSAGAARLFRMLGLHPGPDVTVPAAASLAGVPRAKALALLSELTTVHMLTEHLPGRYTFHDLLRAYAVEQSEQEQDRHGTVHRGLDHYLHSAHAAIRTLDCSQDLPDLATASPGVVSESAATHAEALDWFRAERRVLHRVIAWAAANGLDYHTCLLAWVIADFFSLQGLWHDLEAFQTVALPAEHRCGSLSGQARVHRRLASASVHLGRYDAADLHSARAVELTAQVGDIVALARAYHGQAYVFTRQSRYREALASAEQMLHHSRASGFRRGEGIALNGIGWFRAQLGEHAMALKHCEESVAIHREVNNRFGEASALDSCGYARHRLGDLDGAVQCYLQASDLHAELGGRYALAETYLRLGEVHLDCGNSPAAHTVWRQALDILAEIGHPDLVMVQAKLDSLQRKR